MSLRKLFLSFNLCPKRFHLVKVKMLRLWNPPQNWWQTLNQQKYCIKKKRKIRKGSMNHSYCPWISLAGLNRRYHDTQRRWTVRVVMSCTPPVFRQLAVLVTKENHQLLTVSWVAPNVCTDSLQLPGPLPFQALFSFTPRVQMALAANWSTEQHTT